MRTLVLAFFFPLWAFANPPVSECRHDAHTFRCVQVLRNYDGDTLTVDIPHLPQLFGQAIPVRVKGIDTPEIRTKDRCEKEAGRLAQKLVASMVKQAKKVELHAVERDKYFRILADVQVDGVSLSQILLKNGLAVAYDGGTKAKINWCDLNKRSPAGKK